MRITALLAGVTLLAGAAHAQYDRGYGYGHGSITTNCEQVRNDNRLAGALVGAVIGGVAGGAIGNNLGDDDDHYYYRRNHYRGYHGYRGHRGYRHHRRHYGYHHRKNDNDGEVIAGAVIGALVGGVAGSELAGSQTDCNPRVYGNVAPPTRQAYGRGWSEPRPVAVRDPYANARDPYAGVPDPYANAPDPYARNGDLYGGRDYGEDVHYEEPYQGSGRECRTVTRVTTLPSGEQLREDTQACRDTPNDDWALQ